LLILKWIGTCFAQNLFNQFEKEIFMKLRQPKKTAFEKQQLVIQKCKDKIATEQFIEQYRKSTKDAIEQILNMGTAVKDIYEKYKANELNKYDLNYFCMSVGINQKSSTFRKYDAIGRNADKFRQYMDKLPSAFSTLYEIATLDSETFEKIFINVENCQGLTLKQVKQLAKKSSPTGSSLTPRIKNPCFIKPRLMAKTLSKINRFGIYISTSVKESELKQIVNFFEDLQSRGLLTFDSPEITHYINDEDDGEQLKLAA
jgi:hypothetical protein